MLGDPFKLFFRLLIAGFRIVGYTITCIAQVIWYISSGRPDKIGDAFGDFGRSVTNAIAGIFQEGV